MEVRQEKDEECSLEEDEEKKKKKIAISKFLSAT